MANLLIRFKHVSLLKLKIGRCLQTIQHISTDSFGGDDCASPPVLVDRDDHITLIGLNRPISRNSLSSETVKSLNKALINFEEDRSSPVAVIYGIGGSFCVGPDLTELEISGQSDNYNVLSNYTPILRHPKKPIVCGINGYCVGGGLELAMYCDLRVMEDTAILGFFERFAGFNLINGGIARLPAIVGLSRSLDLLLTGRRVCAQEALKIGLVNRLVATGALQRDRQNIYKNYYERRKGLNAAIEQETASANDKISNEIKRAIASFKISNCKGLQTEAWHVKPKTLPPWEEEEVLHEQKFTFKTNVNKR
ncbi:uncharacterized protein LOC101462666 isoform X2 [Ceratitis capitata]|uniref:uncharacterized protein LOC101462666 isoform X2 n=1 Tax=Ceratitis capitata TaxID=7213 RepID=UPI000A112CDE|nr:uncharacterized protein LOC101462666 isoform X2 [Ceratitis capitata]